MPPVQPVFFFFFLLFPRALVPFSSLRSLRVICPHSFVVFPRVFFFCLSRCSGCPLWFFVKFFLGRMSPAADPSKIRCMWRTPDTSFSASFLSPCLKSVSNVTPFLAMRRFPSPFLLMELLSRPFFGTWGRFSIPLSFLSPDPFACHYLLQP